ncbi:hypothetical protein L1987_68025 [Smallanthus sonchifolius]|uniref:Uncharacterized protein n=1 Tax=Smallanthus sonchifolius TaxID=185202 RepID=A0ACB9B5G8_9ASTR|nr:hypothetical protein L1987_68025 [Smallanthus sonchifolius]
MALHFIMLVAKVKLLGLSHLHTTATPILASLIWPFCFKLLLSMRPIRVILEAMTYDSTLFIFQLGRIITSPAFVGRRWDRIVRLAHERIASARQSVALVNHDEGFHTLSMVAL